MSLKETLIKRKSNREFADRKIPLEIINNLVEIALNESPKAHNISSTRVYVLDEIEKKLLGYRLRSRFEENMELRESASYSEKETNLAKLFFEGSTIFFEKAPHVAIVTADLSHCAKINKRILKMEAPDTSLLFDFADEQFTHNGVIFLTNFENMLLEEEGIVSCRINSANLLLRSINRSFLPYDPEKEKLIGLLTFGYPKTKKDG